MHCRIMRTVTLTLSDDALTDLRLLLYRRVLRCADAAAILAQLPQR